MLHPGLDTIYENFQPINAEMQPKQLLWKFLRSLNIKMLSRGPWTHLVAIQPGFNVIPADSQPINAEMWQDRLFGGF